MSISTKHNELADKYGVQYWHRPLVYLQGGLPDVPRPSDRSMYAHNFWQEQFRRLDKGFWCPETNRWINPYYYGHMNFLQFDIENEMEQSSGLQAPLYRDNDEFVHNELYFNLSNWKTLKNGQVYFQSSDNLVTAKGRRMAWTTNLQGFQMIHFVLRQNRSIAKLYATDDKLITENLEMRRLYASLHPMLRYNHKERKPMFLIKESEEMLVQGYYHGSKKVPVNAIKFFVTSKNPGAGRGDKYGLVEVIEAGMHKNLEKVLYAMFDTVGQGEQRFGFIAVGGTSDQITNDTEDYKNIFERPKSYGAKRIFLPSTRVRLGHFDYKTGISNEVTALQSIQNIRAEKAKDPNPNVLLSYTQENPISWEECFIPPSRNEYDRLKLDKQLAHIFTSIKADKDYLRGKLEEQTDGYGRKLGTYTFVRDNAGPWKVHKDGLPQPGEQDNAYGFGIDDFYKDLTKDPTSKGAICVYRMPTLLGHKFPVDVPVAIYEYRPKRTMFHDECILAMKVWPGMVNYEYNDDVFFKRCEDEMMMNRIIHWDGVRPGMTVKTNEIALMTAACNNYLKDDGQKRIIFRDIIDGIKKWQSLNTDIGSAFHLVLALRERITKVMKAGMDVPQKEHQHVPVTGFGFGPDQPQQELVGVGQEEMDWGWRPGW
ncbi:MAG TPA: hypothetical protein VGB67_04105 [Fibrella sp.]|jgi:hypothetical protein